MGPLLALGLLLLAGPARGCPDLLANTCVCIDERPKGAAGAAPRRKVVCSKLRLPDAPDSGLLPNDTVSLILSNNKIVLLKAGAFSGLWALEKLDLKNNLISTIQAGAFHGLSALRRLDLSNNRIGCLNPAVFQSLTSLTRLNLSGNIFSTLNPDLLDGLSSLKVIDFNTELLVCDCNLLWALTWERSRSVRISEDTVCAYPSALRGTPFTELQESQLVCEGPLELPFLQLIPVMRQVVFQGDRLPFLCTATYLDNSTRVLWFHNGSPVRHGDHRGVTVGESLVHDCSLISSELILSNIYLLASGEWECVITTARGNASLKVDIVVIDTSATYCPAQRVANNRGEFRWPRTLAGITVHQPCQQYPHTSSPVRDQLTARKCNRSGMWEEADYSHCLYINDHTRVLSSFILMPVNSSTVLPLARRLLAYTIEATSFLDMMDVIYVSQMIEKFIGWTGKIHELGELIVEMASNLMRVDAGVLRLAQQESGACTRVVWAVERIASLILTANSQTISKVSGNIAVEAFLVKPASFLGLGCTAFQRLPPPGIAGDTAPPPTLPLRFRCSAGNRNASLSGFPLKNSEALAAVQLPPALFAGLADAPRTNASCWLQFVAFRNGKLFPSTGNSSGLADRGQDRTPATPVIFTTAGGCGVEELAEPIQVSLRHWQPGDDQVAARWDFDLLGGVGGWQAAGCLISQTQGNVSTLRCHQFSNVVVLKRISNQSAPVDESVRSLHPIIYTCTAFLLLCLFTAIIAYILRHNTIGISKKSWHMLLNLWFHICMSCAVFTGGINRKDYGLLCQMVGIVLHYSSLSTLLWIGVSARVIYKEATQKLQRQQELELPAPAQRPMLRFYLIAGGIPLIICGITAAVNLHNYSNVSPYCWLAWKPSLGAFYVPAGFTVLVSWIYLLGAGLQLGCRRRGKAEAGGLPEQPAVSSGGQGPDSVSVSGPSPATDVVYSLEARLWALAGTQLLSVGLWICGALSVWGLPPLAVLFSCLYGLGAVALGLGVLTHHCLRRHDVCGPWRGCARRLGAEAGGSPTPPPAGPGPEASASPFPAGGPCKMTNLQAALSQGDRGAARSLTPCVDSEVEAEDKAPACRGHRARTKPPVDGKQQRLRALRASDAASSDTGSLAGSGRLSNGRPGRHASHSPSEGSDSSGQAPGSGPGLQASVSRDSLKQAGPLEKEVKRRSYPQNGAHRAGETGATISAGLWKSETTV